MKRLSDSLAVVVLLVLVAAWMGSTAELLADTYKCQALGCDNQCYASNRWCYTNTDGQNFEQLPKAIVQIGWCTDGQTGGSPGNFDLVSYTVYDKCTPDCAADLGQGSTAAMGVGAGKRRDDKGTFKTTCNKS